MKAGESYFLRFLEGHDKQFVIPVYQRNYDWKKEHCNQLFDDILQIIKTNDSSYFIGSIVSIFDDEATKDGEYVIIDGQQRITSITLFLLAIKNLIEETKLTPEKASLKEQINDTYLVNKYEQNSKRIRLKPIKNDNEAFLKLFDNDKDKRIVSSNITRNYLLFEERLIAAAAMGIKPDEIFDALRKLIIVDIRLTRGVDNPQIIFESLNSTGKDLDQADLVRNFILMDQKPELQETYYEKYWHPIELNTDFNATDFLRHYLTFKNAKTPRKDSVYKAFKDYVKSISKSKQSSDFVELLEEIRLFSKYYKFLTTFCTDSDKINDGLKRIDRLQVTVAYPFLMDVFDLRQRGELSNNEVSEILTIVESFVFRRHICKYATNALNKIFASLSKNIRKYTENTSQYLEVFKYMIARGSKFPTNIEFKEQLVSRDVYNQKARHRIHLFERLENFGNREIVDVEKLLEAKKEGLTFEHIMPQTITPAWRSDLGSDYQTVHEQFVHRLGNLTLTAYNSSLGNKSFIEKLTKENGLKESKLTLNQGLEKNSKWAMDEMIERGNSLADKALQIWSFPTSEFDPESNQAEEFGLDDEINFTGTKPTSFQLLGITKSVNSWRRILQDVCSMLFELDPVKFHEIRRSDECSPYVSADSQTQREPWKLSDEIFVEINLSTAGITNALKVIFHEFDVEDSDFSVSLRSAE